jgi:hypothetical protein
MTPNQHRLYSKVTHFAKDVFFAVLTTQEFLILIDDHDIIPVDSDDLIRARKEEFKITPRLFHLRNNSKLGKYIHEQAAHTA